MTNKSKAEILIALEKEIPSISTEILRYGIASHILQIVGGILLLIISISSAYLTYCFYGVEGPKSIFAILLGLFIAPMSLLISSFALIPGVINLTKVLTAPTIYISEDIIELLNDEYEGDQ